MHGDLRPDKILISDTGRAKLTDLGYAGLLQDLTQQELTDTIGSRLLYISPEHVRGEPVDSRADIYSLGVTLYEMLTGEPPYVGSAIAVLRRHLTEEPTPNPAIPAALMDLIRAAMAKNPEHRPQTCAEFAGSLAQAAPTLTDQWQLSGWDASMSPNGWMLSLTEIGCSEVGCGAKATLACAYQDTAGRACGSAWCADHVALVGSTPFCRRHAAVVRGLEREGQLWLLSQRPSIDDRAMALAAWLGAELDEPLREILRRHYLGSRGVTVIAEGAVRRLENAGETTWERTWGAVHTDRWLDRIDLRVSASAPDRVDLFVAGVQVFSEIPDWILRRRRREPPDQGDHSRFGQRIVAAVQAMIDRSPLLKPAVPAGSSFFS